MNKQISLQQRYQIAALIKAETNKNQMAKIVGFSKKKVFKNKLIEIANGVFVEIS